MKKEIKRDITVYILLMIAAAVVYFWVIPTQIYLSGSAKAETFSPDTFPRFVTVVFFLSALGGLVNALRLWKKACRQEAAQTARSAAESKEKIDWKAALIPYIVFLLVLLYGILFAKLGFIAATAIVPPVILLVIGCRKWHYYLIYYAFAAALYALFKYLLLVPIR